MTKDDLKAILRDLGGATKEAIQMATDPLHKRIQELERGRLEARIQILEAQIDALKAQVDEQKTLPRLRVAR